MLCACAAHRFALVFTRICRCVLQRGMAEPPSGLWPVLSHVHHQPGCPVLLLHALPEILMASSPWPAQSLVSSAALLTVLHLIEEQLLTSAACMQGHWLAHPCLHRSLLLHSAAVDCWLVQG